MPKIYIPVTEYQLPNGTPVQREISRPKEIADKALAIIAMGMQFEMERLTTGDVSFTIFDPSEEVDVGIKICLNPKCKRDVLRAFDKLVTEYSDKHSQRSATKHGAMA